MQLDGIKTRVESASGVCNQRLKLKCDEPFSNVAFNFNVRHYTSEEALAAAREEGHKAGALEMAAKMEEAEAEAEAEHSQEMGDLLVCLGQAGEGGHWSLRTSCKSKTHN